MKRVIAGIIIFILILIVAIVFSSFSIDVDLDKSFLPPSISSPFGYDPLGRSLLAEVSSGVLVSISIALIVSIAAITIGVAISYLMSMNSYLYSFFNIICNSFKVVPSIALALFLSSINGPSILNLVIALSLSMISNVARTMCPRIEVVRKEAYIRIAEGFGIREGRIFLSHGLLAIMPYIREELLSIILSTIVLESSLSYLGCGVGASTPSLGRILSEARPYFLLYPHMVVFPALVLFLLSLSLSLISSGLRSTRA